MHHSQATYRNVFAHNILRTYAIQGIRLKLVSGARVTLDSFLFDYIECTRYVGRGEYIAELRIEMCLNTIFLVRMQINVSNGNCGESYIKFTCDT